MITYRLRALGLLTVLAFLAALVMSSASPASAATTTDGGFNFAKAGATILQDRIVYTATTVDGATIMAQVTDCNATAVVTNDMPSDILLPRLPRSPNTDLPNHLLFPEQISPTVYLLREASFYYCPSFKPRHCGIQCYNSAYD